MRHIETVEITIKGHRQKPFSADIPANLAKEIQLLLKQRLKEDASVPAKSVFPALFDNVEGPSIVLKGARLRENLTQLQLAKKLGIRQHHLSEMENGKRTIGKEMAKKLGEILNANWRVFV